VTTVTDPILKTVPMDDADQPQPTPRSSAEAVRRDFPILATMAHGKPLVYLDNAATTQKPRAVLDRLSRYYQTENANIHRGVYLLSQTATMAYEEARRTVARFIHADDEKQVIFTRGTTESINLVAASYGRSVLKPGDEIILSAMEHHSNIVPWQMIAELTGAKIRVIPMNDAGELLMDDYAKLLNERTKIVSVVHVSNSLGTINDVKTITAMAHAFGAKVMVDGAQWVAHFPTDVREIDCDFYAFSGHKLYGPTGIGILYGRRELLEQMPPYQGGGDMIESVTFAKTTYAPLPNKFEAGTPHIAGAVGLAAAIDYLYAVGFDNFVSHEEELLKYATAQLQTVPGVRLVGTASHKASVLSFVIDDPPISSLDIGTRLDAQGIAVRTGHHCCQPVMDRFGIAATSRASLAMYNTTQDVDALVTALRKIVSDESARRSSVAAQQSASGPASAATKSTIEYPGPFGDSPDAAANELAETFDLLPDRDTKNEYLLDLGRQLPDTFDLLKRIVPRVQGCMSEVYLVPRLKPATADTLEFVADANADIVRGLIALLQRVYSGQRIADVLAFDIEGFFRRIGLDQFITSQRRNGLAGMIQRIRASAQSLGKQKC
jgi:cysteine desulfurase / selenocysteine lyase